MEDFWDTLEVSLRFLQENSTGTNGTNPEGKVIPPNDSQVLRDTLKVYGSIFAVCFFLFCCLRKKYPKAFNIRSWVPELKCALAKQKYGFLSWMWQIRLATDDEIREQCGMDALCFLRMLHFGYKISLLGIFNSIWLFPVYVTSESTGENSYITDRVAQLTVSYIPSGSPRFIATVVASYLIFFYSMYLILKEYKWFTYHRHAWLSALEPRNYSVYVADIPKELQSNQKLLKYFQNCFTDDCVLEANVALNIPKLEKTVARRDNTVLKLEHLINIEDIKGKTPMRRSINPIDPPINAITGTLKDLNELNTQVAQQITAVENKLKFTNEDDGSLASQSLAAGYSVHSGLTGAGYSVTGDTVYGTPTFAGGHITANLVPGESTRVDTSIALRGGEASSVVKVSETGSVTDDEVSRHKSSRNEDEMRKKSNRSIDILESIHTSIHYRVGEGVATMTSVGKGVKNTAVGILLGNEDGSPRSGGFISFKKLRSRQAALQMIHNATPFSMEVWEGVDPDSIKWANVGKSSKQLQVGTVISFSLTALLCLFWTIPVSFIASLTSVDSLSEQVPFLAKWIEKAPWLGDVLAVLAPLILVVVNNILPTILEIFSGLEGPLGDGALSSSVFTKLSAFMIIQTFFVSAISGSIFQELSNIAKQPQLAVDLLATSLPGQSTYFLQILLVSTFIGLAVELLRITPFVKAVGRRLPIFPNLTEDERSRSVFGFFRPLNDPLDFAHPEIGANNILYFMVLFVYTAMAPLVNWFLAFCFVLMNSAYRYAFFCNYPSKPDSGGRMWLTFIKIIQFSMIIAQLTLFGFLALKRTAIAIPLLVPLLVMNLLFQWHISQKHNQVATFLASNECIEIDRKNDLLGPMDYSFLIDEYKQQQLKAKDEVLPDNLSLSREVEHGNDEYRTPPGSVGDVEELNEDEMKSSLLDGVGTN